jgi:NAD(P)-dependent dehydrogenase (short-subunit alcohol dehydrogenase family)
VNIPGARLLRRYQEGETNWTECSQHDKHQEPEDLAGLAVYLAGDESSWATGAVFPVDGGYLAV